MGGSLSGRWPRCTVAIHGLTVASPTDVAPRPAWRRDRIPISPWWITCSCTAASHYWSSATYLLNPSNAVFVAFYIGYAGQDTKSTTYYVRAVRVGS